MMQANTGRFHLMLTGNHEMQLIHDVVLDKEDYVNLLGVNIDKGLNFKLHVNDVCRKTGRQFNVFRRKSRLLNMSAKMQVFNAFVRTNLNHCTLVWIKRNKTDLGRLEKVQERVQSYKWCVFSLYSRSI